MRSKPGSSDCRISALSQRLKGNEQVSDKIPADYLLLKSEAKIIAISGGGRHGAQNYLKMPKAFGAQQVLAKPFLRQEILETISQVLQGVVTCYPLTMVF